MRRCLILTILVFSLAITACSKSSEQGKNVGLQESQMKAICELATMKCYYHNVAKYMDEDATGAWFWAKDRKFWIEYAGIVTLGIDVSKVKIEVEGENVKITLPEAKVLSCKIDDATLTEDSFIVAKGSAKIEAEHQIEAFKDAQAKMEESAKSDSALLASAQQRAQKLLEDYVKNIGDCTGTVYNIEWEYIEDNEVEEPDSTVEE